MSEGRETKSKRRRTITEGEMAGRKGKRAWPVGQLPVEIFSIIAANLPRSSIQNMRLVNKEFEQKISEYLFRAVVVPFRPAIYGISETKNGVGDIVLQDVGMRVFEGYGGRILKFAMSFEFHESQLYNPPVKSEQEAITSFWGIYRWPFKNYHRYSRLEGMEKTADETKTMAKALRFIDKATELGVSIDGGLGWLAGPDINSLYRARDRQPVVFGKLRFAAEESPQSLGVDATDAETRFSTRGKSALYVAFERMLHEAGYRGDSLESSIRMMLETEQGTALQNQAITEGLSTAIRGNTRSAATSRPSSSGSSPSSTTEPTANPLHGEAHNGAEFRATLAKIKFEPEDCYLLKPNSLSSGQKEMLLETEWAQRAFMQSYAIAVIDNPITFQNVRVLTIARLPSRHVPILQRQDFWDSLAHLMKLSLAVIPDWRIVTKMPSSFVQDQIIHPSLAIAPVFQLLYGQISKRRNIKELHFEWLCGGEFAPGVYARNKNILAAPLVPTAMEMLQRKNVMVLELPYIERLSLKNCWISPHIMTTFSVRLKRASLRYLTLESISLTAPVSRSALLTPLYGAAAQNAHVAMQPQILGQVQNLAAQGITNIPPAHPVWTNYVQAAPIAQTTTFTAGSARKWWDKPRVGSWADYIDNMTPALTLSDIRIQHSHDPSPAPRSRSGIIHIEFQSCGYVRLPLLFDQRAVDVVEPEFIVEGVLPRLQEFLPFMMSPGDHCLGTITGFMDEHERETLENAWAMQYGWGTTRVLVQQEARADGVGRPGWGRFDGSV